MTTRILMNYLREKLVDCGICYISSRMGDKRKYSRMSRLAQEQKLFVIETDNQTYYLELIHIRTDKPKDNKEV